MERVKKIVFTSVVNQTSDLTPRFDPLIQPSIYPSFHPSIHPCTNPTDTKSLSNLFGLTEPYGTLFAHSRQQHPVPK